MKDLGYSMDTGVLPVGRLPHALRRDNRYFGGQRLSLLVICLENQGNDSSNEHAELKNSFPCNIHTCHPLSFTIGGKRSITPEKNRGEPPTGALLAAPETAYHTIRQIARKKAGRIMRQCRDTPRFRIPSKTVFQFFLSCKSSSDTKNTSLPSTEIVSA